MLKHRAPSTFQVQTKKQIACHGHEQRKPINIIKIKDQETEKEKNLEMANPSTNHTPAGAESDNNKPDSHYLASGYIPIPTYSRHPKPATGEDGFFASTLSTPSTIPSVHTFKSQFLQAVLPSQPPAWSSPTAPPQLIAVPGADLIMLLQLAEPGVCGHPGTAHGGVLATLIDEAMSLGVTLYAPEAGESVAAAAAGATAASAPAPLRIRSKMFTAQLDVRYKKAVSVPGTVEVRVQVLAKQGKKVWVKAQIVQQGQIMVDAMAFWLLTLGVKSNL
ncbi:PaaI family thioesterase [Aspergillus undulatus]|uniref:PaaI family thioesterase n=1 Tax=Aspergillus undulatus TaxID=1810928 RepID=UPI003CCD4055